MVSLNISVSELINWDNDLVWQAHVLPIVRAARLMGILDRSLIQSADSPRRDNQKDA